MSKKVKTEISLTAETVAIANSIHYALGAIKKSIEHKRPRVSSRANNDLAEAHWKSVLLNIEEARIDLRASGIDARITGFVETQGSSKERQLGRAITNIRSLARQLSNDPALRRIIYSAHFWSLPPGRISREYQGIETIEHALRRTIELTDYMLQPELPLEHTVHHDSARELREIIPHQKVAPVQFSMRGGRIIVVSQPGIPNHRDEANTQASRDHLLNKGSRLLSELQRSNCDPRLLQGFRDLQQSLQSCDNIIQLGLMNIGIEEMGKAFEAELPDALRGMLLGHTRGVAMYVAQFPEWQHFSEKAASAEFTEEDVARISLTANHLISDLEQHSEIADDEVPKTIRALQQLIANPKRASKRAAYAVLRTIENLIAKVFEYCSDFLDKTISKTIEGLSTAASRTIIVALMTVALGGAVGISPLDPKISDIAWVRTAAEIVQGEIEALSK